MIVDIDKLEVGIIVTRKGGGGFVMSLTKMRWGCSFCCARESSEQYTSPLTQFKSGMQANGVKCNDGFQLIVKLSMRQASILQQPTPLETIS